MSDLAMVDTIVLVYRYDPSHPEKQSRAADLLRRGAEDGSLVLPYQALLEFVAATTRPRRGGAPPLLPQREAWREVAEFADLYEILYPDAESVPTAVSLMAVHGLSWFDAVLLAYADRHGLPLVYSEDFTDGRRYGHVRVVNPFA